MMIAATIEQRPALLRAEKVNKVYRSVGVTLVASLGATVVPARRAASIRPAVAVRAVD